MKEDRDDDGGPEWARKVRATGDAAGSLAYAVQAVHLFADDVDWVQQHPHSNIGHVLSIFDKYLRQVDGCLHDAPTRDRLRNVHRGAPVQVGDQAELSACELVFSMSRWRYANVLSEMFGDEELGMAITSEQLELSDVSVPEWGDAWCAWPRIAKAIRRCGPLKAHVLNAYVRAETYAAVAIEHAMVKPAINNPTRPLTLGEAATLMGKKGNRRGRATWLKACIEDGSIQAIRLTRQAYVFDKASFSKHVQDKL